jgi:hypothetical protein
MTAPYHALVWIDHQQARVFRFATTRVGPGDLQSAIVLSPHPHEHLHHKANSSDSGHASIDKAFLHDVVKKLSDAGTILITGPASAKQELTAYLREQQPQTAARIAGVEPLDHPSDGQLIAFARRFFNAADRMQSQFRSAMHR